MTTVAVVGCGYWGQNLVRNFHQLGSLAVVCESDPEKAALVERLAPGVPVVTDLEQVGPSLPLVLATPAETHYRLALQALERGRDVFVEKPLALTLRDGQHLCAVAAAAGRILMVGHILEYHPACLKLGELLRSGELGQLYYLYSHRLSLGKVRQEENILWSFAPHDIALMLRLTGEEPSRVEAAGGSYLQPAIADVTVTTLEFPSGVRGHIHVSWLHPFKEQRLVAIGSRKMAVFDGVANTLTCYDRRIEQLLPVHGDGELVPFEPVEPLRAECQAFLEAVRTRRPPLTDGASGVRVLEVLERAQRSLAGSRP